MKTKLSITQTKIIELMNNGYNCKKKRYGGYVIISADKNDYITCTSTTILKLKSLGILSESLQLTNS